VANCAAKMMSPSFSRFALSTTSTGLPAAMAAAASATGSRDVTGSPSLPLLVPQPSSFLVSRWTPANETRTSIRACHRIIASSPGGETLSRGGSDDTGRVRQDFAIGLVIIPRT
jgi:hypothetical protein